MTVIRNALMVIEIALAIAAFVGGSAMVLRGRQALAEPQGLNPRKVDAVLDIALMDVILVVMAVAAWALYSRASWARWMSIAAGAALIVALAARPSLTGLRRWLAASLALLGVVVVLLAALLPVAD